MLQTKGPEVILGCILDILETQTAGSEERCDAYDKLSRTLTGNDGRFFEQEVAKSIERLLKVIQGDVESSPNDLKKKALQLLGTCIFDIEIVRHMGKTKCEEMLDILLHTISNTKEKSTCSLALWCLKSQNIEQDVIVKKAESILSTLECAMEKWSATSVSVVDGFIGTVERLTSQAPNEMCSKAYRWGKLLLPLVVNKAIQVRETALAVIENNMNTLKTVQKEMVAVLKPVMKHKILPGLKELFKENRKMSLYVLKCWGTLVQFYGVELHNLSYINEFMSVIELGFKSAEPPVKIAAFQAWQQLIDNFGLNKSVIQDPKKISLIMQVFKHNNTRTENVALEKLSCWWHFLWLLGDKVSPNFEQVADPLLNFCVGGKLPKQNGGATPRSLPHTGTQPTFKSIQLLGCEALAHFLGNMEEGKELGHKFKLDPFMHRIVTGPAFFIKHADVLIRTASQLCTGLGKATPDCLALHCWEWLIAHLKTAIDSPSKLDIRKTLSTLLLEFRVVVKSDALPNDVLLRMFERLGSIQKRVLCSSAYSIQGEEMIHGTPALFITRLLLSPTLLVTSSDLDSFHDTFSFLLESGAGNSIGTLGFLQSVVEILKENCIYLDCRETRWRLWSAVQHLLLQHISKSNEINQGDSLEHNFGCSVQTLVFPAVQDLHELPQSLVKTMMKSWSELYKTVNRLAALVTNAETNIICDEVCSQMLDHYLEKDIVEATEVDMLVQMCRVVATSLYFSSLGSQPVFAMSVSPKKFAKNRHKPLENIHSVIVLLGLLQKKTVELVSDCENVKKSTGVSLQTVLNNLVETFSAIFAHVTSSNVISNLIGHLAHPIGELFADSQKKAVKLYNNSFQSKLEKLWMDISTCLQSRYTSLFDSDFLEKCSPLLEATFQHPRRQIKNQTMSMWTCTFGKAAYLHYPESLKPVLTKVKAKSIIELPNWVANISPVIDETPVSQMTQGQAPEPHIPGMPSPHKIHGSLLNKPISPSLKRSPVRNPVSPVAKTSAKKKKLNLDGFDDKDFVLIKPAPKKKMVLTEHQKEVMKEKSVLPAMYNSLEHSVDASLMSAHFTTDTQMDGSLSETPTPTSEPLSLFGSMIPPSNQGTMNTKENEDSKKPIIRNQEKKKAVKKSVKLSDTETDSESGLRRSARVRDQEENSTDKWTKFRTKSEITLPLGETTKKNEKSEFPSNRLSCIVMYDDDDDDVPTDGEFGNDDDQFDAESVGNDDPINMDFVNDENKDVINLFGENMNEKLNSTKCTTEVERKDSKRDLDRIVKESETNSKEAISDSSVKESDSSVPKSVPQNVLGALNFFQSLSGSMLSPKSNSLAKEGSKTAKDFQISDEIASTDTESDLGDSRTVVSKDVHIDQEKMTSEPLQSWTQKLNELSTSPGHASPLRKWSIQDAVVSPRKKSRSSKSPKRNKKKPTDENEEKGTLEKWVIRTPGKSYQGSQSTDLIVANISQTLVEETQSPTKFASEHSRDKISSSIMETPPKNVLENIAVSHSASNRKLFSSQAGNEEYQIVEDSNIVPGSPNSKSFRCGTPVLKLKKLTTEEILSYSPSRKDSSESNEVLNKSRIQSKSFERTKRAIESVEKSKQEKWSGADLLDDLSSHEHDDFSVFTPLETGSKEAKSEGFCSKTLSDTEKVMLDLSEKNKTDPVLLLSGSENLFTQSVTECHTEDAETNTHDMEVDDIHEDENMNLKTAEIGNSVSEDKNDNIDFKQCTNKNELNSENLESSIQGQETGGRGRGRRKQGTPKKLTPEQIKLKKKKDEEHTRIVAKRLCRKLKVKNHDEEKEIKEPRKGKCQKGKMSSENETKKAKKGRKGKKNQSTSSKQGRDKGTKSNSTSEGSSTCLSSEENNDSTQDELEVSVLEDMLDLEEDLHTVKTLKQIKKELKKNKQEQKHTPQCTDQIFVPEKLEETVVANQQTVNGLDTNEKLKNIMNENNSLKRSVKDFVDESVAGIENPEDNKNKENNSKPFSKDAESEVGEYLAEPSKLIPVSDEPYLEMLTGVPFLAVKLGEEQIHPSSETKTDGTLSSPKENDSNLSEIMVNSNAKHENYSDLEIVTENEGSFFSDDDIPIAEIKNKILNDEIDIEKNLEEKNETSLKEQSQPNKECQKIYEKKRTVNGKNTSNETNTCAEINSDKENENASSQAKQSDKNVTEISKTDNIENMNEINRFDETPRKVNDASKPSVAVRLMLRNSDSKLTMGTRKFAKKGGAARRSILKPSQARSLEEMDSPQRKPFHPITVGRIYSPTASPSASILKGPKRKFSEDDCLETDSPPTKQRRVSFATPLADVTRVDMTRPPSPLVKVAGKSSSQEPGSLTQSGKYLETQSTPGSPSQKFYESSQDTQINTTEPVCPELIGCDQSVEKILPQLMASSWSKGLSNLVRARNIHTIGDLSSLTEGDIHNLPIRSPKVDTVKKVLTKFGKNIGSTRPNRQNQSSKVTLELKVKSGETNPEMKQLRGNTLVNDAKQSGSVTTTTTEKEMEVQVDDISNSGSLLDEVNRLMNTTDQSAAQEFIDFKPGDQSEDRAGSSKTNINLTDALLQFCNTKEIDVNNLSAHELVKISQNLTTMLSEVNKAIENVVSTRCSSPWR